MGSKHELQGYGDCDKNGTDTSNATLARNVKCDIAQLKVKHLEITLSSANESKMIKAIETLTYVQKNGYVQSRKHMMGFEVSVPLNIM